MPTVLRFAGLRAVIYTNDHRPAHVHVIGDGCEAVFEMNCEGGPITYARIMASPWFVSVASRRFCSSIETAFVRLGGGFMALSDEFKAANRCAQRRLKQTPTATAASYDRRSGRIVINLGSGIDLLLTPQSVEGLANATPSQLSTIEISPSGFGLHFPKLDADLYLPALLEGVLGSKKWMASTLGSLGGQKTSAAKKRASRANGKLGGRPKRSVAG